MVTGRPCIASKIARKSPRCMGSNSASAAIALLARVGKDHPPHRNNAAGIEEHVFGAAEADAFGAEAARRGRIGGRVGIASHFQPARGIRPFHERAEIARHFRMTHGNARPRTPGRLRRRW